MTLQHSVPSQQLCAWWGRLTEHGPAFQHFLNPSKTWRVIKPEHHEEATHTKVFADSSINIISEGRRVSSMLYMYITEYMYVSKKAKEWSSNSKYPQHNSHISTTCCHLSTNSWAIKKMDTPQSSSV